MNEPSLRKSGFFCLSSTRSLEIKRARSAKLGIVFNAIVARLRGVKHHAENCKKQVSTAQAHEDFQHDQTGCMNTSHAGAHPVEANKHGDAKQSSGQPVAAKKSEVLA